jgi:hypothetical protein
MSKKHSLLLGVVALGLAAAGLARANQAEQISVPLTFPDRAGKLVLERHQGSISVKAYEGATVLIKASFRRPPGSAFLDRDAGGMKPVPAAAIQLTLRRPTTSSRSMPIPGRNPSTWTSLSPSGFRLN